MSKIITYVCSNIPIKDEHELCSKLIKEIPNIELYALKHIQELFTLLSDPQYNTDYIVFDIDDLSNMNGLASFDIVRALSTVIECTVHRKNKNSKPVKRNTKIIAMISENTSLSLFKELISMNEIDNFSLRYGSKVNYEMIKHCVINFINDGERPPKIITNLLKPKKQEKKANDQIKLTTRQQQIFDIISTRGVSNKHISKMLNISESTVKLHVGCLLKKYGVKNRTQLAVFNNKNTSEVHA